MMLDETKNHDTQYLPEHPDKIRKVYEKPTLTCLDALDIETGQANVPETNDGLVS